MLNVFGITVLDSSVVLEFNFPRSMLEGPLGAIATPAYSYGLNASFAP